MEQKILKRLYYHNEFLKKHFKTYSKFYNNINIQKGGGFSVNYKNNKIDFESILEEDRMTIFLSSKNNSDEYCIMIIIDKSNNIAYIEGITNNKFNNCFDTPELNKGFSIMEMSIKMLKKYKDKLNINVIQLKDNSFIYCNNETKIWLSSLSFLQYNNTFYGRFGFIPKDKDAFTNYKKNQKIIKNTITSSLKLNKIMDKYDNKINNEIDIMNYYIKYKDSNIMKWFNKISHKYLSVDCDFFLYLINSIFQELKLEKFKQETFIMNV